MARQTHSPIPFCAMIINRNKMPETSITLCQSAFVEQFVMLGAAMFHLQPAWPTPPSCLRWRQTQPFRSGTSHLPFWVWVGPGVLSAEKWNSSRPVKGQKAECELAGNLSPAALHKPVQKQPAARWKHQGNYGHQPAAQGPRISALLGWAGRWSASWLFVGSGGGGGGVGNVTLMGDDAPEASRLSKATSARPAEPSDALEAPPARPGSRCPTLPWRSLCTSWGSTKPGATEVAARRFTRAPTESSWTLWTASEGSSRKCLVQFHVLSWKGLTWKQVLNKI